jgi:N-acetylglucosamine kinase-like BadF-type ATPase
MVYYLIADAGSTKIQWALVEAGEGFVKPFRTLGLNALTATDSETESVLLDANSRIPDDAEIESVEYYGAGCATPASCERMRMLICSIFDCRRVIVESDLVGAARSLLGDERGIACILGTGSNSCLYDGRRIKANTPSLGYVLGDEGSGNAIGRRLLSDYLKHQMPNDIADKFASVPDTDLCTALQKIYTEPGANRWLASLAKFAADNIAHEYLESLVKDEFRRFIKRNVSPYFVDTDPHTTPICFTGGIAAGFATQLTEVCDEYELYLERITSDPMQGLVSRHLMRMGVI